MPRWLLYTLLTMLLWGVWGLVSKPLSSGLSSWQVQCLSTLGILPVLALLGFSRNFRTGGPNRTRAFTLALASGIVGSAGNVACYAALGAGGKASAVMPLTSLYPLVTIVFALLLLGERLSGMQFAGIGASLIALGFFNIGSGSDLISPWLLLALVPIMLWGVSGLLQKVATNYGSGMFVTFAFLLGFLPGALLTPVLHPMVWLLPAATWGLLVAHGLLFGLGNLTVILAYGSGGRASVVTPMASLYTLLTIPLAILLLGEHVSLTESAGILFALAAVVALSREKTVESAP
jgi:transporter family protein